MLVYNILCLTLGITLCIIAGCIAADSSNTRKTVRCKKSSNKLDDIDEMILWGEVNNEEFFKP